MSSFCTNCAESLEPGTKFCGACGTPVESIPIPTTSAPVPKALSSRARGNRYPALRIIATILKVFAVLTVIGAVLSAFSTASLPSSIGVGLAGPAVGFLVVIFGLCYGLFLWASAEMIQVLIDIEENTRRGPA
jgi:protein-S-isoprenylcysteine O-methyltransferase Ste14